MARNSWHVLLELSAALQQQGAVPIQISYLRLRKYDIQRTAGATVAKRNMIDLNWRDRGQLDGSDLSKMIPTTKFLTAIIWVNTAFQDLLLTSN